MEDNENKKLTADEMLDAAIDKYNSSVSDLYKLAFHSNEFKMFVNVMEDYVDQQVSDLRKENDELKAKISGYSFMKGTSRIHQMISRSGI